MRIKRDRQQKNLKSDQSFDLYVLGLTDSVAASLATAPASASRLHETLNAQEATRLLTQLLDDTESDSPSPRRYC